MRKHMKFKEKKAIQKEKNKNLCSFIKNAKESKKKSCVMKSNKFCSHLIKGEYFLWKYRQWTINETTTTKY